MRYELLKSGIFSPPKIEKKWQNKTSKIVWRRIQVFCIWLIEWIRISTQSIRKEKIELCLVFWWEKQRHKHYDKMGNSKQFQLKFHCFVLIKSKLFRCSKRKSITFNFTNWKWFHSHTCLLLRFPFCLTDSCRTKRANNINDLSLE